MRHVADVRNQEYRTSSIHKLSLYRFEDGNEDIKSLLQWPEILTELSIGDYFESVDLDVQSLLVPHKNNLVVLNLGFPVHRHRFDFSSFTALRVLKMCYWPLISRHRWRLTRRQVNRLMAPQLGHIHWYFAGQRGEDGPPNNVDQFDEDWLTDLADLVAREHPQLRSVSVDYAQPNEYDPGLAESGWGWRAPPYPKTRFQRVKARYESLGLKFWYNRPLVMWPRWRNELEHERRANEARSPRIY